MLKNFRSAYLSEFCDTLHCCSYPSKQPFLQNNPLIYEPVWSINSDCHKAIIKHVKFSYFVLVTYENGILFNKLF